LHQNGLYIKKATLTGGCENPIKKGNKYFRANPRILGLNIYVVTMIPLINVKIKICHLDQEYLKNIEIL
tara:strand:- start:73 stop:279 length:207 start_codon:yes stop_codon:yes gene_type:complete